MAYGIMGPGYIRVADREQHIAGIEASIKLQRALIETTRGGRSDCAAADLRSLEVQLAHLHWQRRVRRRAIAPIGA